MIKLYKVAVLLILMSTMSMFAQDMKNKNDRFLIEVKTTRIEKKWAINAKRERVLMSETKYAPMDVTTFNNEPVVFKSIKSKYFTSINPNDKVKKHIEFGMIVALTAFINSKDEIVLSGEATIENLVEENNDTKCSQITTKISKIYFNSILNSKINIKSIIINSTNVTNELFIEVRKADLNKNKNR